MKEHHMIKISQNEETTDRYKYNEVELQLPKNDSDIKLKFPNGEILEIQWRVEFGTMDLCLPEENHAVTCWEGFDMKNAKPINKKDKHILSCGQLVIDFGEDYLGCR